LSVNKEIPKTPQITAHTSPTKLYKNFRGADVCCFNKNNILTQTQNGFREGQSTKTAIRDFLESTQKATNVNIKS
jgi:hypothetical protein